MDLFYRLKEETKIQHQQVEKVLVAELKNMSNLSDYSDLLKKLYQFYNPIEKELQKIIPVSFLSDISERKHNSRLLNDIKNIDKSFLPSFKENKLVIDNISYALGVMYVIEGSTLGGQIITQMILKKMPSENLNYTSYFTSYGNNTHIMWAKFKEEVLKSTDKINEDDVITGAKDTFTNLREWLLESKPLEKTV